MAGPVAQWSMHLTTDQKIEGLNPARILAFQEDNKEGVVNLL